MTPRRGSDRLRHRPEVAALSRRSPTDEADDCRGDEDGKPHDGARKDAAFRWLVASCPIPEGEAEETQEHQAKERKAGHRRDLLNVSRIAPQHPLELFGRHSSPGYPAMLLYGCLDELAPAPFFETPSKFP